MQISLSTFVAIIVFFIDIRAVYSLWLIDGIDEKRRYQWLAIIVLLPIVGAIWYFVSGKRRLEAEAGGAGRRA